MGKDSAQGWDTELLAVRSGWHACGKSLSPKPTLSEQDWEAATWVPGVGAQGSGSRVGTFRGSCWEQSVFCWHKEDCAPLPPGDLSVQLGHCPFLDNSSNSYRKWHEKDWACSPLLNPVSLQSGVVVWLSGLRAHIPSRGGPLNPKHPLLHENS